MPKPTRSSPILQGPLTTPPIDAFRNPTEAFRSELLAIRPLFTESHLVLIA